MISIKNLILSPVNEGVFTFFGILENSKTNNNNNNKKNNQQGKSIIGLYDSYSESFWKYCENETKG